MMNPSLTRLLLLILCSANAWAAASLPVPQSLAHSVAQATHQGEPLVVMVSLERCPYCHVARQNYLLPLQKQGAQVIQINMQSTQPVRNFHDQPSSHAAMVRQWGIKVAPTVLFFGKGGTEVAERLEGASPDFYGAYLTQRLDAARAHVQPSP
jgi:thioredoxin-related protein